MINNNCRFRDEGVPHGCRNSNTLPDVRVLACPGSEGLQLALWLAHPGVEEIELAKFPRTYSCITVDRVVSEKMQDRNRYKVKKKKEGANRL
jgi:hypothetical protein